MDNIKAQLLRIQQQLQGLNASQRMLAGSLVAIMVMTMLWWGRYASSPEMVPLLNQTFSAEDVARITEVLDAKGVKYAVSADKILVPADKRLPVLGDLSLNRLMPRDTHKGYEEMLKLDNQWNTSSKSDAIRTDAKAAYLAQIIRTWKGVTAANVILDATTERRIMGGRQPTAIVYVETRDGIKPGPKMAQALVALVAGAQSGLLEKNVKVVINSLPAKVSLADGAFDSEETQDRKFKIAAEYSEKITNHLNIPGVLVAVEVDVESKTVKSSKTQYDPAVKAVAKEGTESSESTRGGGAARDPGASANTRLDLDPAPAATIENTTTSEKTDTQFENRFGSEQTETFSPGGAVRVMSASVRVPRQYFAQVWKNLNKKADAEPDEAALDALIKAELPAVKRAVRASANILGEDAIIVDAYTDLTPAITSPTVASAGGGGVAALLGGHVREIAMGTLALMSLYMVSTIVKRSAPIPAIVRQTDIASPRQIESDEELFGIAGASPGTLDAMELGEEEVRAQQVVEQVSGLVKENPDAAAALVKRWLSK